MFDWREKEKPTNSERILGAFNAGLVRQAWPLFDATRTRQVEISAARQLPSHSLMQRAGLAVAKLAMAIAPHARNVWIPCGPGNNGGDGCEAAAYLKAWGKSPVVTYLGEPDNAPSDAMAAQQKALRSGVVFAPDAPENYDLCIDALFGIGRVRPWNPLCTRWIERMNAGPTAVLAIDLPSGLDADTGATPELHVKASHTLSLLTLKAGLFTANGRTACGEIWFNNLGIEVPEQASAYLSGPPPSTVRAHNTHKGSYGDVCVVGGAASMSGAAVLAARTAIHGGAGRVYVCMLDTAIRLDPGQPELMFRNLADVDLAAMTVVAGCGGGEAIHAFMPQLLAQSAKLVLDADALNVIAKDTALQEALTAREAQTTVLTPHPLEAARLMRMNSANVQANRLGITQAMAERFRCVVVLKGSGSVIAAPGVVPHINPTGNARLATAGTGDVLAGLIGAGLPTGTDAFAVACDAVFRHGQEADRWSSTATMTALNLVEAL